MRKKLTVVLLLFLLSLTLLEVKAPRQSASFGAAMGQTAPTQSSKPTTVEGRRSALQEFEEAARLALSNGQTLEAARSLTRAGSLQLLLNEPKSAVASHLQALELLQQSPNPQLEVHNLSGCAAAYLKAPPSKDDPNPPNYPALAQSALDRAIQLSRDNQYTAGEAEALLILSDLQNHSNHVTALRTAQDALVLWKNLNDQDGVALSYYSIGTYYLALNSVNEAEENFKRALELHRTLNNAARQAAALIS